MSGGVVAGFAAAWVLRPPGRVVLGVSGGSDSMALLRLAVAAGGEVAAATVDHGLRPGSGAEAARVAAWCADLGVPHAILRWQGWDGRGNLQAAARDARHALLAAHAAGATVALGHTADDQAETVVLRLARGSGVDGLGAMAEFGPGRLMRPLLTLARADLRAHLVGLGQAWIDDPANDDDRFDRVRARAILAALAPLGVTAARLGRTARLMRAARVTLDARRAEDAAALVTWGPHGTADLDAAGVAALPLERRLRLVAHVLGAVSGRPLRPRLGALEALAGDLDGPGRALHGCLIQPMAARAMVLREPAAVGPPLYLGEGPVLWDNRWWIEGPPGVTIAPLGAAAPPGLPPLVRATLPGLWDGAALVGAPHAGIGPWRARAGPHWPVA